MTLLCRNYSLDYIKHFTLYLFYYIKQTNDFNTY
jgi:hypothetical protein